jgi:hypothetical protein
MYVVIVERSSTVFKLIFIYFYSSFLRNVDNIIRNKQTKLFVSFDLLKLSFYGTGCYQGHKKQTVWMADLKGLFAYVYVFHLSYSKVEHLIFIRLILDRRERP